MMVKRLMKVIVQIPCFNESETLPATLADLPKTGPGGVKIEVLIIDDGSTDGTSEVAQKLGVQHVVRHSVNRGLAAAFQSGISRALELGADVIVNTDADNQYRGEDVLRLLDPIIREKADLVVGIRPIAQIEHFSWLKKRLQCLGSFVVRKLSGTEVRDVTSGFRAFSRHAAVQLNLTTRFTYTLETLIQAAHKNLRIAQTDIRINPVTRESRLFRSNAQYITRAMRDLFQVYLFYQGVKFFTYLGFLFFLPGTLLGGRFVFLHYLYGESGKVQSLILCAILLLMGFQCWLFAVLLAALSGNRVLAENVLSRLKLQK